MPKKEEIGFNFRNTDQSNLTNDDVVGIPHLSSIHLAVLTRSRKQCHTLDRICIVEIGSLLTTISYFRWIYIMIYRFCLFLLGKD